MVLISISILCLDFLIAPILSEISGFLCITLIKFFRFKWKYNIFYLVYSILLIITIISTWFFSFNSGLSTQPPMSAERPLSLTKISLVMTISLVFPLLLISLTKLISDKKFEEPILVGSDAKYPLLFIAFLEEILFRWALLIPLYSLTNNIFLSLSATGILFLFNHGFIILNSKNKLLTLMPILILTVFLSLIYIYSGLIYCIVTHVTYDMLLIIIKNHFQ
ncbi:conserved membrane protein of unknown function [Oenococcus oeni]|uniref:CPBP family glutamic-type intramembrane protease n=1 Tax=Oenococcus oeni TaxID=1247 RepID=UPI001078D94A|nr:CPBP family glutamic-type intramembrane protease [Oenococcus oeni]AVI94946.1 hypothetical protein AX764_09095 [Oenococcus oeni]SYV98564.1 conserved membrane hypothetical protein [Oenococcus oeni]SYW04546.1 conserved membrane hypothetical protein [Oenococcus oeni]SYW19025.1 conserved membrane hypothetical protein [Oenococcus oeni]VDC15593.1 conserved membrane protein of unknown function [Oenococcus oeni]